MFNNKLTATIKLKNFESQSFGVFFFKTFIFLMGIGELPNSPSVMETESSREDLLRGVSSAALIACLTGLPKNWIWGLFLSDERNVTKMLSSWSS